MARISTNTSDKIIAIKRWLGVNENPDGDTNLKMGEASEMRNFRVTNEGSLQIRPGMKSLFTIANAPVKSLWTGYVSGRESIVAACDGQIWTLDLEENTATAVGVFDTSDTVTFFGYDEKLYMLNGQKYKVWDGTTLAEVMGYRPLILVSTVPTGGGTALERVNMLNGLRKVHFSPTGTANVFQLPEKGLSSVDYVKNLSSGTNYTLTTDYTVDLANGKVTFTTLTETFSGNGTITTFTLANKNSISGVGQITIGGAINTAWTYNSSTGIVTFTTAPSTGTNNIVVTEVKLNAPLTGTNTLEIGYSVPTTLRSQIEAMKYAELYNGATDNRVFFYGDGSNKAFYSDLDYNGSATAEYFPDLNVINVGDANTPLTGMTRHYNQLMAFKTDSSYAIGYGTLTLATGAVTASFFCTAVNKGIGNDAPGQVQNVVNYPRTLDGKTIYEWRPTSTTGNVTSDQRNAMRISERVENTLSGFALPDAVTFVDKYNHEYYVLYGGMAAVHNYAADAWYFYTDFSPSVLLSYRGELYGGTSDGRILRLSRDYHNDDGAPIDAYWQSGAMDFGADFMRKYASELFITLKPELFAGVIVTVRTNLKSDFEERTVSYGLGTFKHANFAHWSFGTNRQPQTRRLKLKAKKFAYYQLIFKSNTDWSTATILSADFKVRSMGEIK
ncbi:hypothetical protein IZU99_03095 [Oscillospiraceae bacterium CM]|nr:hypothetical protein IZU99_03095 [Oscillospiraceae bacterium CM]